MTTAITAAEQKLFTEAGITPAEDTKYTHVSYMYRDANNYKQHGDAYFFGAPTIESCLRLVRAADQSTGDVAFIPESVAMPPLQRQFTNFKWDDEADHPFHTITGMRGLDDLPEDARVIGDLKDLVAEFEDAHENSGLAGEWLDPIDRAWEAGLQDDDDDDEDEVERPSC